MRSLLLAALLSVLAPLAAGATYESSINVSFPDEVAGLPFAGRSEFPQKELGVNIAYQRTGPVRGSVYIYNGGLKSIPSGTDAPIVRRHFTQVIAEVKQLEALGKARVTLSAGGEQITSFSGCGPQFIWQSYEMELPEGTLNSFTYLTALNSNFVKLRVSYRKGDTQGSQDTERFVQQIRQILGNCK